jgi:hypothetical protein
MLQFIFIVVITLLALIAGVGYWRYRYVSSVIAKCSKNLDTSYGSKGVISGPPPVPFIGMSHFSFHRLYAICIPRAR